VGRGKEAFHPIFTAQAGALDLSRGKVVEGEERYV
jgi:hypothetical protein